MVERLLEFGATEATEVLEPIREDDSFPLHRALALAELLGPEPTEAELDEMEVWMAGYGLDFREFSRDAWSEVSERMAAAGYEQ